MNDYRIADKPKLKEAMESMAPTVLFSGPWGSGKTRLIAEKAYFLCGRWPGYRAGLIRKELVHVRRTTWKFLIDYVIPPWILQRSHYNKSELEIKLPNGSEIWGCGIDQPTKLASTEFGFMGIEEATEITKEETFSWIEGRARQPEAPFHQVMYACNAGPPSHHLYKKFFIEKPRDEKGNSLTQLVEGEVLWDILPPSYRARLSMLKGKYRDRFLLNKWTGYEGLIYDCFNPATHSIPRFRIPESWRYVMDIDFGYNAPLVCQYWAISPDEKWYLEREIYYSHRTVNQHAPLIKKMMEERNLIPGVLNRKDNAGKVILRECEIYSDHDSEDQATLEEYGISSQNADKNVSAGIQKVWEMINGNQVFFFEDALIEKDPMLEAKDFPTRTSEELGGYIWMNDQKEQPKKENDHGMDGMRYGIYSHYNEAQPGFFFAGGEKRIAA